MSATSPAIGCVVINWSWRYAQFFIPALNVCQALSKRVASTNER